VTGTPGFGDFAGALGEDRKVAIRYPRDLTAEEAQKIGNVLKAIVS